MKTLYLLFILCFGSFISAQNFDYHPSDWYILNDVDFKFKLPVKQVEATTFTLNKEDEKNEMWQKDILIFKNNRLIKWEQQDVQFGQNFTQVYNYVGEDEFKFHSREIIDKSGKVIEEASYIYDEKDSDMITEILVKEFDPNLHDAPPLKFKIDVVRNDKGIREKDVYFGLNSQMRNEIKISYNDTGLISSRKQFDKEGNWLSTDSIEYDHLFRRNKEITIYPNQNSSDEPVVITMEYKYNKNGYVGQMEVQDSVISFDYKLDAKGNWIERRSYVTRNGERKPYQLVERKIEYGL